MRSFVLLALAVSLASGCSPAPSVPDCPEGSFRCIDRCLPFGSTCGDGGVIDAGPGNDGGPDHDADVDASIDPDVDGGPMSCVGADGLPIVRFCRDGATVAYCAGGADLACRADQHCEEHFDHAHTAHHAGCFFEGQWPCDLATDRASSCEGSVIEVCMEGSTFDTGTTIDCAETLGWDDATCVPSGELFFCTSPSSPSCDPTTFAPRCDGARRVECQSGIAFADGPVVVRVDCGLGLECIDSRVDSHGVCLGIDAVSTGRPPMSGYRGLRCRSETTVEVESEGYVFGFECPLATHFGSEGEVTVQQVCVVDGDGGYACVDPEDATPCTTEAPTCELGAGAGNESHRCVDQGDGRRVIAVQSCVAPGDPISTGTDCVAGECQHTGACVPTDAPVCYGQSRVYCHPARHTWASEYCGSECTDGVCR